MAKKVVFYSDGEWLDRDKPNEKVQLAILQYLGADEIVYMVAEYEAGFASGIDWEGLSEEGVVAVVLFYVNDACVFGMSLEAEFLKLGAYEFDSKGLDKLRNLAVTGQEKLVLKFDS